MGRDGSGNQGADAEPPHRDAGHQAALVREPLDQHGHRNDVGEADADARNHAITEIEPAKTAIGKAGEEGAQAVKSSARDGHHSRSAAIIPKTAQKSGKAHHQDADGEGQGHLWDAPVKERRQRLAENAPGVNRPQGHLQQNAGGGDAPSFAIHRSPFVRSGPNLPADIELNHGAKEPGTRRSYQGVFKDNPASAVLSTVTTMFLAAG